MTKYEEKVMNIIEELVEKVESDPIEMDVVSNFSNSILVCGFVEDEGTSLDIVKGFKMYVAFHGSTYYDVNKRMLLSEIFGKENIIYASHCSDGIDKEWWERYSPTYDIYLVSDNAW